MASKETASSRSGSQESGSSHEGTSPKTPWDTLKSFAKERGGSIYRRGIELGNTALRAIGAGVEGLRSNSDNSRHIDLSTPDSEAGRGSVEDGQDEVSTSTPESQTGNSGDDKENDEPVDGGEQDESGAEEDQQKKETPEARLINRRRASVNEARQRLGAIEDKNSPEYQLAAQDVEAAEIQLQAVEDQFGSSEQIKEESGADGKRDDAGDKGDAESQETSESEDDKEDKKSPETQTPEDAARAKIAELEKILNDDNATDDEKYRAAYMRKQLLNGLMSKSSEGTKSAGDASKVETADDGSGPEPADDSAEATKKDLKKERSAVAKELAEAMQQLSKHKSGDPAYDGLSARVRGLRNRFNYISKQIRGEVDDDKERDGDKEKGKELVPKGKDLVPYDSSVADPDRVINNPEADGITKYEAINELEQKVAGARNKYAEIRAEYEQTGMFKKLLKGKELKKRMELARAELEGFMTQLVYQQKNEERSVIVNGVEGANEEE